MLPAVDEQLDCTRIHSVTFEFRLASKHFFLQFSRPRDLAMMVTRTLTCYTRCSLGSSAIVHRLALCFLGGGGGGEGMQPWMTNCSLITLYYYILLLLAELIYLAHKITTRGPNLCINAVKEETVLASRCLSQIHWSHLPMLAAATFPPSHSIEIFRSRRRTVSPMTSSYDSREV